MHPKNRRSYWPPMKTSHRFLEVAFVSFLRERGGPIYGDTMTVIRSVFVPNNGWLRIPGRPSLHLHESSLSSHCGKIKFDLQLAHSQISQNTIHIVHVSGQISNVRSDLMCESFMSFYVPIIFSILPSIAHSFYSQCAFSRRSGKYEISTIINSYIIYTRDMIYTYDMHCSYRPSQSPIQLTASKWSKLTFERVTFVWYKGENLTCPMSQKIVNVYHCIRSVEHADMEFLRRTSHRTCHVIRHNIHLVYHWQVTDRHDGKTEWLSKSDTRAGHRAWRRTKRQMLSVQARNPSWLRGLRKERGRSLGHVCCSLSLSAAAVVFVPPRKRREPCRRGKTGPTTSRSTKVASADGHTWLRTAFRPPPHGGELSSPRCARPRLLHPSISIQLDPIGRRAVTAWWESTLRRGVSTETAAASRGITSLLASRRRRRERVWGSSVARCGVRGGR